MGEVIERLQASNPQIAARMLAPMTRWRRYAVGQETMRAELERLAAIDPLPKDVFEVVTTCPSLIVRFMPFNTWL